MTTIPRNVSGILIKNEKLNFNIIMDCGEGTLQQFQDHFPEKEFEQTISHLSIIFVSHMHTDHYAGLQGILESRLKVLSKLNKSPQENPLFLIFPYCLSQWIASLNNHLNQFHCHFIFV